MKKTVFLFIILFSLNCFSQKNPEGQIGSWYMYNGSHLLSDKISLKSMAHFRFFDLANDIQQFIGRVGVNYKLNKNVSTTLGFAYLNTDATYGVNEGNVNEERFYQDLNIKHHLSKLGIAHRFRAEQRFFNETFGHFVRYQLGLNYPISNKWSTYIYDEVFFDFDDEVFNQNWLGAGVTYKASKEIKLKLGYQNIEINNGPQFDRVLLGLILTTDHRKKTKI